MMDMALDPVALNGLDQDAKQRLWGDALTGVALVALDPTVFGGVRVRAHAGPVRDALLAQLHSCIGGDVPVRRMPSHIADERLLGGLDMAATLRAGKPVTQRGLLSEADGGLVVAPMAERLDPLTVSRLTAVLDRGFVALERDGLAAVLEAKIGLVALDEGLGDERLAAALSDRLAFDVDLSALSIRDLAAPVLSHDDVHAARAVFGAIDADDRVFETLTALATAFGVSSVRVVLFAIRAARGLAALDGRTQVEDQDIELAARLVIAPRATRLPMQESEDEEAPPPDQEDHSQDDQPHEPEAKEDEADQDEDTPPPDGPLEDQVLEAVAAAIPSQLLEQLKAKAALAGSKAQSSAGQGAQQQALFRGRPIGSRRGRLDGRAKLHLIDTLRAAAPWQKLRRRPAESAARISVTGDDIRVRRYKQNEESVTIFVVDASGSSALHRLAEVKGAVELLLAESYARRDYVALITFRGEGADMALPPTRSLVRAKRCLSGLPGGGGTPLAAGLSAALEAALECRRQGRTPRVVVMSDAQANVGYDPSLGRAGARADALVAARHIAAHNVAGLFIDTSPQRGRKRNAAEGASKAMEIAQAMAAIHLALPHANAAGLADLIQSDADQRMAG